MPYGLFDYTPDDTIHTMGLSPTAVVGEPPPQLPGGWTDPYGSREDPLKPLPPMPVVTGFQQNVGENPYTRGPQCEQTGTCNQEQKQTLPYDPRVTYNMPGENLPWPSPPDKEVETQPVSSPIGQGSPKPPTPPGTRPPNYGNVPSMGPVTLAMPEDPKNLISPKNPYTDGPESLPKPPGKPPPVVTLAIPEDPKDSIPPHNPYTDAALCSENPKFCRSPNPLPPMPPPGQPKTLMSTGEYAGDEQRPLPPVSTLAIPENPGKVAPPVLLPPQAFPPAEPRPPMVTKAMVCSENVAACAKPPPMGPVTLAIPENPAEKQWCGFAINMGPNIQRVCGTFSHHLQKGNSKGGTAIFVGGDMGVIVYPTFKQALDAKRKLR